MAARTCLLCGKPLSRIWAGTGEDFCSREHRNQYRLRRGMDRLLEANQIATVMRRREQPKQIPAAELRAPGPAARRTFLEPLKTALPPIVTPSPQPGVQPGLISTTRFRHPRALAGEFGDSRLAAPPAMMARAVSVPRSMAQLKAHVAPASSTPYRKRRNRSANPQSESIRWRGAGRPVVGALLAKAAQQTASPMPESRPARRFAVPIRGRALRVSTAAAFRLPESMRPTVQFTPPATSGLPQPDARRMRAAVGPPAVERMPRDIAAEPQALRVPPSPQPNFERRFRWPEALDMSLPTHHPSNARRASAVPFGPPEESLSKERI